MRGRLAKPCGFTLIEVMISLIILAIGVVGVMTLQVTTYGNLQTSHNYSKAAMLASDMADRMQANAAQARADAYVHTAIPGTVKNCSTTACTAVELVNYDISEWQIQVTGVEGLNPKRPGSLPSGAGAVAVNGTDPVDYDITIRWDDDLSGSSGQGCDSTDPADLDCYVVTVRP